MKWELLLMADNKPKTEDDWLAKEFEAKQYFTPAASRHENHG